MSERQPLHPGHRQVSKRQLQSGERRRLYRDVHSVTTYHFTKQTAIMHAMLNPSFQNVKLINFYTFRRVVVF